MDPSALEDSDINGPIPESVIAETEEQLGFSLPSEYRSFMLQTDGGEGYVGKSYVVLWRVSELVVFNREYEVSTYAPGLFIFGSNGAGEGFAFDTRDLGMSVVVVPFIGLSLEDALPISDTFRGFLTAAANGTIF